MFSTSAARSSKKKKNEPRRSFSTTRPILRLRVPEIFGVGMCDRTAGFYHVFVGVCGECMESNDVSYEVFFALCL